MKIELISYRRFGYQCPVALIFIDQSIKAYTSEGVLSLANRYSADADMFTYLTQIFHHLNAIKNAEIQEISFDDISGQTNLF